MVTSNFLTMNSVTLFCLLACVSVSPALDNGLARTPPMGWLTWERFRCNTDCVNDPDNCLSEKLIKEMALHMAKDGYLEAGYEYITVDDCWPLHDRGKDGRIVPDPKRFPNGMKALADYVHGLGLKFGIYGDFGTKTCGGYPGSLYYLELDAQTFAEWGVDLLKLDGCYCDPKDFDTGYPAMGQWLNLTGRPILYSCSWPAYQVGSGMKPDYASIAKYCNIWRNYGDIQDSWSSVQSIINFYAKDQYNFSSVAGPGHFNDPDMIIIGNFGLSHDQERSQMAIWSVMAAPLVMSNDLRNMRSQSRDLLLNKRLIAVNQDKLGVQGTVVKTDGHIQIWRKAILPTGSFAVAVLNMGDGGAPSRLQYTLAAMTDAHSALNLTEVFDGKSLGVLKPGDKLQFTVNPSGVFMFTANPVKSEERPVDHVLRFDGL